VTSSGRGGTYSSDGAERTDGRRAFHARAAATGKAQSPSVVRPLDGTTSVDVEALRRRRREPMSAVRWRVSARYDGAAPLRQRYARIWSDSLRNFQPMWFTEEWSYMCSDFLAENTRRAAALKTDCSRCDSCVRK